MRRIFAERKRPRQARRTYSAFERPKAATALEAGTLRNRRRSGMHQTSEQALHRRYTKRSVSVAALVCVPSQRGHTVR